MQDSECLKANMTGDAAHESDHCQNKKTKTNARGLVSAAVYLLLLFGMLAGINIFNRRTVLAKPETNPTAAENILSIQREPENSISVVTLGNSISYTSISPMQLWNSYGVTSFDCGQAGHTIQEAYETLKTVFSCQAPSVILLETSLLYTDTASKGSAVWDKSLNTWSDFKFDFLHYHDIWKTLLLHKDYENESYKGFLVRWDIASYTGDLRYMDANAEYEEREFCYWGRFYLDLIRKYCRQHDASLILYSSVSPRYYNHRTHTDLEQYAQENDVTFLDFNMIPDEIELNWKVDFIDDGEHVNMNGARKITDYMGRYLKEHYDLPDHRNEDAFSSWNDLYLKYQTRL